MSGYQSNDGTSKGKLRLVKPSPQYTPVDRYKVKCESAEEVTRYYKLTAEFQFTIVEGKYTGVSLPGWVPVSYRAYRQYCEIALGRGLDDDDDPPPPSIFVGKVFIVEARYKRTNGKNRTLLDDTVKKVSWDELRANVILSLVK
jgi:hypothetical protein